MNTTAMTPSAREKAKTELRKMYEADHFHPLEAIAFFRRWPRSLTRNFFYTIVFNILFTIVFSSLAFIFTRDATFRDLPRLFANNFVIANVIGFSFWIVLTALGPLQRVVNRQPYWVVTLFYAVVGTGIVTGSMWVYAFATGRKGMLGWVGSAEQLTTGFVISLVISCVISLLWKRRSEELLSQIVLAEEQERVAAAERAAADANLRALQAQIEPHFLFNTLANVTSLIHSHPDDAKRMLEDFIAYLRATLASTREQNTTLGGEFAMMRKFLSILEIRMGKRLRTELVLPAELGNAAMPPMLLQPLIENAIKHGLEPKMEGGTLELTAERVGESVKISVTDTGLGFDNKPSNGIGLKNVRERIAKLYGGNGNVSIEENKPSGTRVMVTIPYSESK